MSREKFLTMAVVFLLVLNAGIVGFLFFSRPRPPELWKMVVKEVGFDDQQQQAYLVLREEHHHNITRLNDQFAEKLQQYLMQLETSADQSKEDLLATELAAIEKTKAEVTLNHFREVKALCRPQQAVDFDRIIPRLTQIMLPIQERGRGPRR